MHAKLAALILVLWVGMPAHAASIDQPMEHAAQEHTARAIFTALRCVVCEGQSLAESDAALAIQMRAHVRTLVAQGKTQPEILDFFSQHYGSDILMTPPMQSSTIVLWFAPLLLLIIGGVALWRCTRTPTHGSHHD